MIDHFALFVSHGLLLLATWRLLVREDLNDEGPRKAWAARRRPEDARDA